MPASVPTIFALSTAPGRAGVAVVRVSGPGAGQALDTIAPPRPTPRVASLRTLHDPGTGNVIDRGLVLWFPAPASFTGEDMAELQVHGGRAVIKALLAALIQLDDCRLAEPGEFARRAFESGKLDLVEVEGLADLIDAETEAQRRQALRQASGAVSARYERWRNEIIAASALVEAAIDFSDEADVVADAVAQARRRAEKLHREIERTIADEGRGEIVREGFRVVLAGPPNVGKSSLLNALARRDAAIVSEEAGTTRDVVEVHLDLDGLAVIVADTAGLRETMGKIEQLGIARTLARAQDAHAILWIMDAENPCPAVPAALLDTEALVLPVLNKIDLLRGAMPEGVPADALRLSAKTGAGIDKLACRLATLARERTSGEEEPVITQTRHRAELTRAAEGLAAFLRGDRRDPELRAEDLRQAASALGRVTGHIDAEDVLDQVFQRFCIGK